VFNLRLESLPWIARVMARSRPDSSLEQAIALARRAVDARPSKENRITLAKCLRADGQEAAAETVLEAARTASSTYPRDTASMPALEQ
jgi:hypothetical protein